MLCIELAEARDRLSWKRAFCVFVCFQVCLQFAKPAIIVRASETTERRENRVFIYGGPSL